jgi:hypothetical protein
MGEDLLGRAVAVKILSPQLAAVGREQAVRTEAAHRSSLPPS